MNTRILILLSALTTLLFSSCEKHTSIRPSGQISTKTATVSNFSKIDISHAFNAHITISDGSNQVEIEANDNLHPYIDVKREGNTLCVGIKNHTNIRGNATLNVYIATDYLDGFEASGASHIQLNDELDVEKCIIDLSGASSLSGNVVVDELHCDLSGASALNLSGFCDYLYADLSGASNLSNYQLSVSWFDAELSGASNAQLTINERMDINASGASELLYKGNASVHQINLSGASEVRRID